MREVIAAALQATTGAGAPPRPHGPFECSQHNVTYDHRVDNPDALNWCPVPDGGADALLFIGMAVFVSAVLYHKLSAVWTLLAGAAYAALSNAFNLGHFSNALTLWLGISPAPLFFFLFLPPLLLDSAARIDFFIFKRIAIVCLVFAFANVVIGAFALIPFLQFGLGLAKEGWRAIDCALFASMLAATDAVAVAAILKGGGAPELLGVVMEGESLFNDASSIVLFEIFLKLSSEGKEGGKLSLLIDDMLVEIVQLAVVGTAVGLVMGFATRLMFSLLQRRSCPPHVEVSITLGGAYLSYLFAEYYGIFGFHGSGVIAVVVYGLYGSSTLFFGLSAKGRRNNAFTGFWDAIQFIANGLVFFFVGASVVNFFVRIAPEEGPAGSGGGAWGLAVTAASLLVTRVVPVSLATLGLRGALIAAEAPLLSLVGPTLGWGELVFVTFGGLRGGLALILAQTVMTGHHAHDIDPHQQHIRASMVLWTAGIVLVSLVVQAPLLMPLMRILGLNKTTPAKSHMHKRARAAVAAYTKQALLDLQRDDDEMLRGVDWKQVFDEVDISQEVEEVFRTTETSESSDDESDGGLSVPAGGDLEAPADLASGGSLAASLRAPLAALSRMGSYRRRRRGRRTSTGGDRTPAGAGSALDGFLPNGGGAAGGLAGGEDPLSPGAAAPPLPTGEDIFIANRISAQDRALLEHAAAAVDCPFVKPGAEADGGAGAGAGDEAAAAAAAAAGEEASVIRNASQASMADSAAGDAPPPAPAAPAPAPAPAEAGGARPAEMPLLLPLVVACREVTPSAALHPRADRTPSYHQSLPPEPRAAAGAALARALGAAGGAPPGAPPGAEFGSGRGGSGSMRRGGLSQASFIWKEMGSHVALVDMDVADEEEFVVESRLSLLAGFKRHFRYKSAEGLLSSQGLRLLDYACDACMAHPGRPVDLWAHVENEVVSHGTISGLAMVHYRLRRVQTAVIRSGRKGNVFAKLLQDPLSWLSRKTRNRLSLTTMATLEVALELWLALTASPQARWINYCNTHASALLQEELRQQSGVVWKFIVDREVEAPGEFSACQTQRATLAVLRRQLAFVEQLGHLGAIEEEEQEALGELLEEKLAHLERRGPRWRPPSISEVLGRVPFLADASEETKVWLRAYGDMRGFEPGQCILPPNSRGPPGVFIVLSGLVRVVVARGGAMETHYVGVGGQIGLYSSLVGKRSQAFDLVAAYAQGNAMGWGPVLLQLPPRVLQAIRQRAAEGRPAFGDLLVNMHRQAGLQVFDWLAGDVIRALAAHLGATLDALIAAAHAAPDARAARRARKLMELLLAPAAGAAAAAAVGGAGGGGGAEVADAMGVAAAGGGGAGAAAALAAGVGARALDRVLEGGDEEVVARMVADRAHEAADQLRAILCGAEVLQLAPGEHWTQASSALVLGGALTPLGTDAAAAAAKGAPPPAPPPESPRGLAALAAAAAEGSLHGGGAFGGRDGSFHGGGGYFAGLGGGGGAQPVVSLRKLAAPCVMGWAPELFEPMEGRRLYAPRQLTFKAGAHGALLLVAPSDASSAGSITGGSPSHRRGAGAGGSGSATAAGGSGGACAAGAAAAMGAAARGAAAAAAVGSPSGLRRMTSSVPLRVSLNRAHVDGHTHG